MREMNGSQFFLMTAPNPDLGKYTCFGHIEEGQRVADRLEVGDVLYEAHLVPPAPSRKKAPADEDSKDEGSKDESSKDEDAPKK